MPTRSRLSLPFLIPLLLVCTALLALTAYLLGGFPTGRIKAAPYTDTSADLPAEGTENPPPIACIVIDAGHGGEDGGTSSAAGVLEKDLNLSVAFALRDLLEAAGVPVVMTRTEDKLLYDRNVDFQGRKKVLDLAARRIVAEKTAAAAAESGGTSLFISIHMNAFPAPRYDGMQVWYSAADPRSCEVAASIQSLATTLMPDNRRKPKEAGSSIYLLEHASCPAVLVECGFLSNPTEAERLADRDYQYGLATVILGGILPYLSPAG